MLYINLGSVFHQNYCIRIKKWHFFCSLFLLFLFRFLCFFFILLHSFTVSIFLGVICFLFLVRYLIQFENKCFYIVTVCKTSFYLDLIPKKFTYFSWSSSLRIVYIFLNKSSIMDFVTGDFVSRNTRNGVPISLPARTMTCLDPLPKSGTCNSSPDSSDEELC